MTLAEKTNITAGTGIFMGRCVGNTGSALRVGIPQLCLQDGPLGVRNTDHNTAFPAGITVGATWDKDLMYRRGVAIGEEFRGKGVNVHLGPSVGPLGRKPRGGRSISPVTQRMIYCDRNADQIQTGKDSALIRYSKLSEVLSASKAYKVSESLPQSSI